MSAWLDESYARGQSAWPTLKLDRARWAQQLAALGHTVPSSGLHVEDLWLACACLVGAPGALAVFDAQHRAALQRAAERLAPSSSSPDDLVQLLYAKLFVAAERAPAPAIGGYAGRGSLAAWLRMSLAHLALDARRGRAAREVPIEGDIVAWPAAGDDPELAAIRERHGADFRAAFEAAMGTLTPRERNLLRQHVLYQMTLDQLAGLYRVHRSAVARWLADARQRLLLETRQRLGERLGANRAQVESLLTLLRSQVDVSIERLLAATA